MWTTVALLIAQATYGNADDWVVEIQPIAEDRRVDTDTFVVVDGSRVAGVVADRVVVVHAGGAEVDVGPRGDRDVTSDTFAVSDEDGAVRVLADDRDELRRIVGPPFRKWVRAISCHGDACAFIDRNGLIFQVGWQPTLLERDNGENYGDAPWNEGPNDAPSSPLCGLMDGCRLTVSEDGKQVTLNDVRYDVRTLKKRAQPRPVERERFRWAGCDDAGVGHARGALVTRCSWKANLPRRDRFGRNEPKVFAPEPPRFIVLDDDAVLLLDVDPRLAWDWYRRWPTPGLDAGPGLLHLDGSVVVTFVKGGVTLQPLPELRGWRFPAGAALDDGWHLVTDSDRAALVRVTRR